MKETFRVLRVRAREILWLKPLAVGIVSVLGALLAHLADAAALDAFVLEIEQGAAEDLLKIMASSMLVIATFAVASMIAAYGSAGTAATPRAFPLVIADDVSKNALSTFVGAFIFSVVALTALMNGYYGKAGRFTIFVLSLLVLSVVIISFVRWVDRIARLGRLGSVIDKVEEATCEALTLRRATPRLGGVGVTAAAFEIPIRSSSIGYVQHIDTAALQKRAETGKLRIRVEALPGTFASPDRVIARVDTGGAGLSDADRAAIADAFVIGDARAFHDDPRFGLVVLSEIAGRALSPAVNDPGTAIDIIGTTVRLFAIWAEPAQKRTPRETFDRVEVPELNLRDMFDDAFTAIARDGAGTVEVVVRLQKAFQSLSTLDVPGIRDVATAHARLALTRALHALEIAEDQAVARESATLCRSP